VVTHEGRESTVAVKTHYNVSFIRNLFTFKDILFFGKELILNSDFFNCMAYTKKTKTNPHVSSELSIGGYLLFGFFGL
jgi:hypothetical protein